MTLSNFNSVKMTIALSGRWTRQVLFHLVEERAWSMLSWENFKHLGWDYWPFNYVGLSKYWISYDRVTLTSPGLSLGKAKLASSLVCPRAIQSSAKQTSLAGQPMWWLAMPSGRRAGIPGESGIQTHPLVKHIGAQSCNEPFCHPRKTIGNKSKVTDSIWHAVIGLFRWAIWLCKWYLIRLVMWTIWLGDMIGQLSGLCRWIYRTDIE